MNANYLAQLNAARAANGNQPNQEDIKKAMSDIKQYSGALSGFDKDELKELNELMDKVDNLSDILTKLAPLQSKLEALKENAAVIESAVDELVGTVEESPIDPFEGYTEEQTYAINVQVIKEFETESRLSKDLLKLSETQVLEAEVPDDVPEFYGLTKEQTVQVYMQVMAEFDNKTELANRLAYNAGLE